VGVKVFVKNFQTIKNTYGAAEDSLKSVRNRRVQFVKLTLRRPIITYVDNLSTLSAKMHKNVAISISFLSIEGVDVAQISANFRFSIVQIQQNAALQVMSKLCNLSFKNTLNKLANNEEIIQKIQHSFDNLSQLLITHEE